MKREERVKTELDYGDFDPEERMLITNALHLFGEQGHSGGSAGFVIGAMRGLAKKLFREDELVPGSYLFLMTTQIRQQKSEELRYKLYNVLAKLMDHKPISPLTGEDDEWGEVSEDLLQNKRCGSVFKDKVTGLVHDIDGRTFSNPSYTYRGWVGYSRGGTAPEVTFPYEPVKQWIHIADEGIGIFLPETFDDNAFLQYVFQLKLAGFDPKHNIIEPDILFLKRDECLPVKGFFDTVVKQKDLSDQYSFDFPEDDVTIDPLIIKAYRLRAILGYNFKEIENGVFEVMGVKMKFDLQQVYIPSRHYQAWIPYLDEKENTERFVWNLSICGRDGKTETEYFHIDRLKGHSDILVPVGGDTDDYLYRKRRELGLKHPKGKKRYAASERVVVEMFEEPDVDSPVEEGSNEVLGCDGGG